MKNILFATFAAAAIASSASAQVNYATAPTIAQVLTEAQISTGTGTTLSNIDARALGVDSLGRLYFYTTEAADATGRLVRVDLAGPTFTTIATQAELLAVMNAGDASPATAVQNSGLIVLSDNRIVMSTFSGTDDILLVTPGTPSTITALVANTDGVAGIEVNAAQTEVIFLTETGFGGDDAIKSVPLSGGTVTTLANTAAITTAAGGTGLGSSGSGITSTGNLLFWNEGGFGGNENIVQLSGTTVTALGTITNGDFDEITVAADDAIIGWNEGGSLGDGVFVYPTPYNFASPLITTEAAINTALGTTGDRESANSGSAAYKPNANTTIYYVADENGAGIFSLTYTGSPVSNVESWNLYSY